MSLIRGNKAMLSKPLESMEAMELIADEFEAVQVAAMALAFMLECT